MPLRAPYIPQVSLDVNRLKAPATVALRAQVGPPDVAIITFMMKILQTLFSGRMNTPPQLFYTISDRMSSNRGKLKYFFITPFQTGCQVTAASLSIFLLNRSRPNVK
jgi:hypothetical protein